MTGDKDKHIFTPLDDIPKDRADPFNSARLDLTRRALLSQLQRLPTQPSILETLRKVGIVFNSRCIGRFFPCPSRAGYRNRTQKPLCIGLFGGLGQGKSSVVLQALGEFTRKNTKFHYYPFDVSRFTPSQLEYEFDRIIGSWERFTKRFGPLLFVTLGIISGWLFISIGKTDVYNKVFFSKGLSLVIFSSITITLRKSFTSWWREFEYHYHVYGFKHSFNWALTNLLKKPDLIVIDNLDRASLPQQRALLRALHRHNQFLGYSFIVCMDETLLLADKPNPEAPQELLRKVIPVELRLPARVPEDATALGLSILRDCKVINDNLNILDDPLFIADFCTLASLQPGFSPRSVKRLLNDSLMHAAELGVTDCAEDCSALVKYHLCLHMFPETRTAPHRLTRLLEGREELPDEEHREQFNKLMVKTRSIMPLDGQWRRLIGGFGTALGLVSPPPRTDLGLEQFLCEAKRRLRKSNDRYDSTNHETLTDHPRDVFVDLWIRLDAIRGGYSDFDYRNWLARALLDRSESKVLTLAHTSVMLAHTSDPLQRLRLYRFLRSTMMKSAEETEIVRKIEYTFLRRWLGDSDAMKLTGNDERKELTKLLVRLEAPQVLCLLPLVPKESLPLGDALRHLISTELSGDQLEVATLRKWLRRNRITISDSLPTNISSSDCSLINRIWPPLPPVCHSDSEHQDWVDQLEAHLTNWRAMRFVSCLRPYSLACWFNNPANWENATGLDLNHKKRLLESLSPLFCSSDEDWDLVLWKRLGINDLQHIRHFVSSIPSHARLTKLQNECALLLRCLLCDKQPLHGMPLKPIVSTGLLRIICGSGKPAATFWMNITTSQARVVLANFSKDRNLACFAPNIKRFLSYNPEEIELLDFLGMDPLMEE